jgi:hypothetical protein
MQTRSSLALFAPDCQSTAGATPQTAHLIRNIPNLSESDVDCHAKYRRSSTGKFFRIPHKGKRSEENSQRVLLILIGNSEFGPARETSQSKGHNCAIGAPSEFKPNVPILNFEWNWRSRTRFTPYYTWVDWDSREERLHTHKCSKSYTPIVKKHNESVGRPLYRNSRIQRVPQIRSI